MRNAHAVTGWAILFIECRQNGRLRRCWALVYAYDGTNVLLDTIELEFYTTTSCVAKVGGGRFATHLQGRQNRDFSAIIWVTRHSVAKM